MQADKDEEDRSRRIRFRLYWMTSIFSMLAFLFLMYWAAVLQFPPGKFPPKPGLAISTILFIASAVPLLNRIQ